MREHTGQVIGGVSPIGHPAPVPTYIDPWLRKYDVVWAAAGHPAAVFSTSYDELVAMTGATPVEVDRADVRTTDGDLAQPGLLQVPDGRRRARRGRRRLRRASLPRRPAHGRGARGRGLDRLGLEPWDIARPKEAQEEGIDLAREPGQRDAWLAALAEHPRALQRPIITAADGTTVVGRDPESLDRVLDAER